MRIDSLQYFIEEQQKKIQKDKQKEDAIYKIKKVCTVILCFIGVVIFCEITLFLLGV